MATFTIYLLREGIKKAEEAVVPDAKMQVVADGASEYGKLFVKATPQRYPKWSKFFDPYVDRKTLGHVQSSAAVFIVSAGGRLFALTFGHGRFILRPEAYEERFGLLVTLNSVKSDALRSVDKRTFIDEQNSRVQTSQASAASDFGIDIERDLIRGIVGYPEAAELGKRLAGADALTATIVAEISDIKKILRRYLKAFESKEYQAKFPWVDKIRQLHPKGERVEKLNDMLVDKLRDAWKKNGISDVCWISIPDIVDWAHVKGFKFTRMKKEGVSSDLHLPGLVQAFPDADPTVDFLKMQHAMSVDDNELPIDKWVVYKCLHCEMDLEGKSFVLSAGHWFEIDKEFSESVDDFYGQINIYEHDFPLYAHDDEGDYNEQVAEQSQGKWCLMDRKNVPVGGIYDKVEFCDLYGDKFIVHVKRYGSSSVLGHLFNQGLVSGELLKSSEEFVQLVNERLGQEHALNLDDKTPRDISEYTVVFGVISQSNKNELHLPFFAKVVLKSVCSRLRDLGYRDVMLAKINCEPAFVYTKKLKPGNKVMK